MKSILKMMAALLLMTAMAATVSAGDDADTAKKADCDKSVKRGGHKGGGGGPMERGGRRQRGPMMGGGRMMFHDLDLSEDQMKQVADIMKSNREANTGNMEKIQKLQEELTKLTNDDTFDETAIRKVAKELSDLRIEMMVSAAKNQQAIKAILTPEQKDKLKAKKAAREEMMKKMKEQMGKRRENMKKFRKAKEDADTEAK